MPGQRSGVDVGIRAWDAGNVTGSLPDGLTSPKSTEAMALPLSWPGYHASTTPLTWSSHGITTALPVWSTTTVLGLAAATAATNAFSLAGRLIVGRSRSSCVKRLTKTTATSAFCAAAAADAGLLPSSYVTLALLPARALMPLRGVTTYGATTLALPPPADSVSAPASPPMTAIEWSCAGSKGSTLPAFFNSTVPSSAAVRAKAAWSALV